MRLRGLRAQLCLWHAALMAATLLALAGFTYALLIGVLHSRADAALLREADNQARQIAITLYRTGGQEGRSAELPHFLSNDLRSWGRYIQVIDLQGNIREKSDGLNTHPLPVSAAALRNGIKGYRSWETVQNLGEHPVRIVTVPVRMGERVPLLVQAGTSLEGVDAALQRAGWILLILTPAVFAIALVGGWLLVGRALRRVDDLTRTALDIQSTNLERRIHHAGPEDEIGRLAQAFDQMITRLDRSFQQARRFSADASHELKTPLTAIRGEAEVALMGELAPAEYQRSLQSILESAERMSQVVESLLLLSRADSGQDLIHSEPVELAELVLEAVENVEFAAREKQVTLLLEEVEPATVAGDPLWLSQVITNLLTNAIKYSGAHTEVDVRLRTVDGKAELCVADHGIGIDPEHLPHIFDRFYRVDRGRARASGGAGLGLSITRWAVEAHGGEITVESTLGEGSRFYVRLPLLELEDEDTEAPAATSAA